MCVGKVWKRAIHENQHPQNRAKRYRTVLQKTFSIYLKSQIVWVIVSADNNNKNKPSKDRC